MAKLKGPLFSLGAAGAVGKTLVYFGWKGLDVVREYVIPANPKTDPQKLQRGYLIAAVAAIHLSQADTLHPLVGKDASAYALWGSIFPTPRTWFNQACKAWIDCQVDEKYGVIYRGEYDIDLAHDKGEFGIYFIEHVGGAIAAGKFYLGTSRTALLKSKDATLVSGIQAYLTSGAGFDDLVKGVKYFWQFVPDPTGYAEGAKSGIYYFTAT